MNLPGPNVGELVAELNSLGQSVIDTAYPEVAAALKGIPRVEWVHPFITFDAADYELHLRLDNRHAMFIEALGLRICKDPRFRRLLDLHRQIDRQGRRIYCGVTVCVQTLIALSNGPPEDDSMASTPEQRIEAQAIKKQYEQVLRLLQGRRGSALAELLGLITKETGKSVELTAVFWFPQDPKIAGHDKAFQAYHSRLQDALFALRDTEEYSSWELRYQAFKKTCPAFMVHTQMQIQTVPEGAARTVQSGLHSKSEMTANDRRFLRSIRVMADDTPD